MPFVIEINTRESSRFEKPKQLVNFFTLVDVNLKYDSLVSDFKFEYLYDSSNVDHTEIAGVSHYHEAIISYDYKDGSREKLLTGFVLSQNFVDSPVPEVLSIGGYSKPGLLEDCDIPVTIPHESDGLKLVDIITRVANAFNLRFVIKSARANETVKNTKEADRLSNGGESEPDTSGKANSEVPKSTADVSENAKNYLASLCLQKNLLLTHDADGRLVIKTANTEGPAVLTFDADRYPSFGYEKMNLNYNGQSMYSDITIVRQADDEDGNSSSFTITNPLCPVRAVPRPKVETQSSGDDITVEEAAKAALSKCLKSIILTIEIMSETANTRIVKPDNAILVKNKKLSLFKMTKFFIESVRIVETAEHTRQTLVCVLPWVHNYNAKGYGKKSGGPYNIFVEPGSNYPIE